jgi:hypothetical protein
MMKLSSFVMLSFQDVKLPSWAATELSLMVAAAELTLVVAAVKLTLMGGINIVMVVATTEVTTVTSDLKDSNSFSLNSISGLCHRT